MSVIKINRDDKIIEEFAEFVVKMVQKGAKLNIKNEQEIIALFKAYVGKYCF